MWFRTKKMRDAAAAAAADRVRAATTNVWCKTGKATAGGGKSSFSDDQAQGSHSFKNKTEEVEYEGSLSSAIAAFIAASARRRLPGFLFREEAKSEDRTISKRVSRMLVGHSFFISHENKKDSSIKLFDRSHAEHFALSESLSLPPLLALTFVHYISSYCRYPSRSEDVLPSLLVQLRESIVWQGMCVDYIQNERFHSGDERMREYGSQTLTPCQLKELEADFVIRTWWRACLFRSGLLATQLVTLPVWLCLAILMPHFLHAILAHNCLLLRDKYAALPAPPPTQALNCGTMIKQNHLKSTAKCPGALPGGRDSRLPIPETVPRPRVVAHPRCLKTSSARNVNTTNTRWNQHGWDHHNSTTRNNPTPDVSVSPFKLTEQIHKRIQACDEGAHIHARLAALPTDVVAAAVVLNILFVFLYFLS